MQGGKGRKAHLVKGQKRWEQQGCEVLLDAREKQVIQMRTSQRSASQWWVNLHSRHHRNAEITQAALLIWLAVEVTLNGTSRMWVAASSPDQHHAQQVPCSSHRRHRAVYSVQYGLYVALYFLLYDGSVSYSFEESSSLIANCRNKASVSDVRTKGSDSRNASFQFFQVLRRNNSGCTEMLMIFFCVVL